MFAEDITLYATGNDVSHIQSTIQDDLDCVLTWFRKNRLFMNPSFVGTPQRTKHHSLLIKINAVILKQVEFVKLLGICIDCNPTWKYHTTDVLKKLFSKVGVICRLYRDLPSKLLIIMYRTVFQPCPDYCLTVWGACPDSYIRPLLSLQNRVARCVTGNYDWDTPGLSLVSQLGCMNVKQRQSYLFGMLMYKCINNVCPAYLSPLFKYVDETHTKSTRSSSLNMLYTPKPNLSCFKESFSYKGAIYWNNLPAHIKTNNSLNTFNMSLKKLILDKII